jgi:hypothetical protein
MQDLSRVAANITHKPGLSKVGRVTLSLFIVLAFVAAGYLLVRKPRNGPSIKEGDLKAPSVGPNDTAFVPLHRNPQIRPIGLSEAASRPLLLIQSPESRPVAGALILSPQASMRQVHLKSCPPIAKTGTDGIAELPPVDIGSAAPGLTIWSPGYLSERTAYPPNGECYVITLRKGASHQVRCRDSVDAGVANAVVTLSKINLESASTAPDLYGNDETIPCGHPKAEVYRAVTDSEGIANFATIATGRYVCRVNHPWMMPVSKDQSVITVDVTQPPTISRVDMAVLWGVAFQARDDEIIYYSLGAMANAGYVPTQLTYFGDIETRLVRRWPGASVVVFVPKPGASNGSIRGTIFLRKGGERQIALTSVPLKDLEAPTIIEPLASAEGHKCGLLTIISQTIEGDLITGLPFELRSVGAMRMHTTLSGVESAVPPGKYTIRAKWGFPVIGADNNQVAIAPAETKVVRLRFGVAVRKCQIVPTCDWTDRLDRVFCRLSIEDLEEHTFWDTPPFSCLLPVGGEASVSVRLHGIPEVISRFRVLGGSSPDDVQVIHAPLGL